MLSEMLQTLSVQPLWTELMHYRAQSGYSTTQPTQIQTAEWFLSSNYASDDVHDVHMWMCVIFFLQISGSLFCLQCVSFPVKVSCEIVSFSQSYWWICEQIWTYELSTTAGGPGQDWDMLACLPAGLGVPGDPRRGAVKWGLGLSGWVTGPCKLSLEDTPASD